MQQPGQADEALGGTPHETSFNNCVVYFQTRLVDERNQEVQFRTGTRNEGLEAWPNGEKIIDNILAGRPASDSAPFRLHPRRNRLLLKVSNFSGPFCLVARVAGTGIRIEPE